MIKEIVKGYGLFAHTSLCLNGDARRGEIWRNEIREYLKRDSM